MCGQNVSISELADESVNQGKNLNKKLQRGTLTSDEMQLIANALGVKFEQNIYPSGRRKAAS